MERGILAEGGGGREESTLESVGSLSQNQLNLQYLN